MNRMLLGVCLGFLLASPSAWPFRTSKPPTLTDLNPSQITELNVFLERVWNLTNGRYSVDSVTTNPDGSRRGDEGDLILYNNAGSRKLCASIGGTTWRCDPSALTAP